MTARYACVDVTAFPLQALLRLRPQLQGKPVAVLDGDPPFEQVCSCNRAAMTLGMSLGMTKLEMEMFPTALVLARSRAEEATANTALLECAGAFSPRVEDLSSDGCFTCMIDIAGTETLFGSPDALGERLLKRILGAWHTRIHCYQQQLSCSQVPCPRPLAACRHSCCATWNGVYGACSVATRCSRSFSGACGNILHVGHHHARSLGEAGGNRADCAPWASRQRAAPAGTGRVTAFIYRDRIQPDTGRANRSRLTDLNCSIRCCLL